MNAYSARVVRLLATLGCVLLVAGCSMIRLGYSQADTLLSWTADQYFDLDAEQEQQFNARLNLLLRWHRYEALPEYAQFLTTAKQKAQQRLTREDALWFVDGVIARYRVIVMRGVVDAADMLATLTPDNINALNRQWEKANRRFAREHKLDGSPDERLRARATRTLKQVKEWVGELSPEQEARIAALSDALPPVERLRYEDRLRRQREFLALLAMRSNKTEFLPRLRHWLLNWAEGRAPEYRWLLAEAYEKRVALYIAIDRMLTPQQRATFLRRVTDYIDDFNALSERRRVTENQSQSQQ